MNVTWVQGLPEGDEKGTFLTLDLGGTNLRVCKVTLLGQGKRDVEQEQYRMMPEMKTGTAKQLWTYIADSTAQFLKTYKLDQKYSTNEPLPLGFTFSYPVHQDSIDHGTLTTWTKGFDIKGVEGEDVADALTTAFEERKLPVKIIAVVNDTVGALIASSYSDPESVIGAIFGTGCNAAYMESCGSIPKIDRSKGLKDDQLISINCEYGAFDNAHKVLPLTKYDKQIDEESPRPGEQAFEKLSAGLYLGEIFRLVLLDLEKRKLLFTDRDQDASALKHPYCIDTGILSGIEDDETPRFQKTREMFLELLNIFLKEYEIEFVRRLAEMIAVRGARLCSCGIAAICRKKGIRSGHVAADGSVANKHPKFKRRWRNALAEVLDWKEGEDPISMTSAEDGSGLGAAIICAMELKRREKLVR